MILGTVGLIAAFIAIGLWVDKRVSLLPRKEELQEASRPRRPTDAPHEAGLAPRTALRLDATRMAAVLGRQRCKACKRTLDADAPSEILFDGRHLLSVRLTCAACGEHRAMYFDPK
jgi:RNase P subunit RPR2